MNRSLPPSPRGRGAGFNTANRFESTRREWDLRPAVLRRRRQVDRVLSLPLDVVEGQRADHRLPPAVVAHQRAGPIQADRHRGRGRLELRQGVAPVLILDLLTAGETIRGRPSIGRA